MTKIINSLYNMRLLDDLARKETTIHKLHPLVKLLTTVVYLTVVVSFGRNEISSLLPFIFYPVIIFALGASCSNSQKGIACTTFYHWNWDIKSTV